MKRKRIVASTKPVTTIVVAGTPQHYFHCEALGRCRAILINADENLPAELSKGEKLELLMDCGDRLHKRFQAFYRAYHELPLDDYEGRKEAFRKFERVNQASTELTRKMVELLEGKEARLLPSPILCIPKLKNSELKNLHAYWQAKGREFWSTDMEMSDEEYSEMQQILSHCDDEIELRRHRGLWA